VTSFPAVAFLNHLLEDAPWARERLAPFGGRTTRVVLAPLPDLAFVVLEDGRLAVSDAPEAHLVVALRPAAVPLLLRRDEALLHEVEFSGDAELAAALQFLFRNLDWDIEEDLARVVGDVAAHRLAAAGRSFVAWQQEAAERAGRNVAEYLTEEAGLLAQPAEVARFGRDVDDLRDAVERLEQRLDRLERLERPGRGPARG
jgi:ubiquinone biosynthesis protein UbiJ